MLGAPNIMTKLTRFTSSVCAVLLSFAIVAISLVQPVSAQRPKRSTSKPSAQTYTTQLAAIEKAIDDKRKELGIPGVSLVIVKDDRIIYMKGLGLKDFEQKIPVTPDTLFAIGSAS